ncbi:P2Y purinoceptor 13 [Spea bombifrons]|uniref:P2Y purinoceptor 13 n=1 Tax=Spea bombifrons TaxID=233779 RepID=UPI00234AC690|nr:P2Y purinoceptor 13 [Spea bombifrons]
MNTETFNNSNGSSLIPRYCSRDNRTTHFVFPVLYAIVFILGFILNTLSLWIFFYVPSSTVFVIFLKNTLVADLLMVLMLPFKILTDSGLAPWKLKYFVCRFSAVLFYETMYISIIFLGLIGLDRFLKIVRPLEKNRMDKTYIAKWISLGVWILIFGISLPNMILSNKNATSESVKKCANLKSPLGLKWHETVNYICQFIFWSVFISMIIFYTIITKKVYKSYQKSRSTNSSRTKKIKARVFVVVVVFFLCFAPFHFSRIPYTFSQTGVIKDCHLQKKLFLAKESTLWMATTNVCMDPLIYVLLCKPFRKLILRFSGSRNPSLETQVANESTV